MKDISVEIADQYDVRKLSEEIRSFNGSTIFHEPLFLSYHNEKMSHLVFKRNNNIIVFIPGNIINNVFISPYKSSFGGIITKKQFDFLTCDKIVDSMITFLTTVGVKKICIAPPPSIYYGDNFTDYMNFVLLSKGFRLGECYLLLVSKIKKDKKICRMNEKSNSLTYKISTDHTVSYNIVKNLQKEKFDKIPTHSYNDIIKISSLYPNNILSFVAYLGDVPIGTIILFLCNKYVAYTFYIAHVQEYSQYRPIMFLIKSILDWLSDKGYMYLDLGSSTFGYTPHYSLIRFKENFDTTGVIKYTYVYDIPSSIQTLHTR